MVLIWLSLKNMFFFLKGYSIYANINKKYLANQAINTYDFGKINIMSNGDVFANMNFLPIGNIYKDSVYDIVCKELNEGESWFRVRDKEPCNRCVFQWLCPSPSDYEIAIGLTNLCHVM